MNDLIHLVFNFVVLYVLMALVAVFLFWVVDKNIPPKNILPVGVMWWAAWRWPVTLSQIFVALALRFYLHYKYENKK
jgi:hypothetical protein